MPKLIDASPRSAACETGLEEQGHAMLQRRRDGLCAASLVALLGMCTALFASATHAAEANPRTGTPPSAASFDCGGAMNAMEKLICSDIQVSVLDGELQQAYKTALASTGASGKKALAEEQRNWIRYARSTCLDTTCLREVYTHRIAVLARNEKYIGNDEPYCTKPSGYQGNVQCGVSVQFHRDPNGHVESFNQSLVEKKLSGRIIACHRLMSLWEGTHIGPGRGEQSVGAYCTRQDGAQRQNVVVCSDDMMGDFQVHPVFAGEMSDAHLIDFAYGCSGG
jgi:uncharacterized protein